MCELLKGYFNSVAGAGHVNNGKGVLTMNHYDPKNPDQHFFASTVFGWGVSRSPIGAVDKALESVPAHLREAINVVIFHVPAPPQAEYRINFYAPDVNGTTKIYEGTV